MDEIYSETMDACKCNESSKISAVHCGAVDLGRFQLCVAVIVLDCGFDLLRS